MKIYADSTETSFFKTDNHIKGLHEIEINTIEDFVYKYSLDSAILLDIKCWMVRRFDELLPGNPWLDRSDEPDLHGEWMEVDFVADMPYLDILVEIAKFEDITSSMEDYKNSSVFQSIKHEWINDDTEERWVITALKDTRQLEVLIDAEDNTTVRIINNEL